MNTSTLFITLLVVIAFSVVSAARFSIMTYTSSSCSNSNPTAHTVEGGTCINFNSDGIQFDGKFACVAGSTTNISLTKYNTTNCSGSPSEVEYLNSLECNKESGAGIKFTTDACSAGAQVVVAIVAMMAILFASM